tara:strand:+ start:14337 stop:14561 length:225 start_codon:yes stop_codon:yes gene_type:complete
MIIESLVQKYLLKLLKAKAEKEGVNVESVGIMLQTDPRDKNKSIIFSEFEVEEIVNYSFKQYLTKKEIITLTKS